MSERTPKSAGHEPVLGIDVTSLSTSTGGTVHVWVTDPGATAIIYPAGTVFSYTITPLASGITAPGPVTVAAPASTLPNNSTNAATVAILVAAGVAVGAYSVSGHAVTPAGTTVASVTGSFAVV